MAETQVLIVGAGPVGLTLALDLGQRGVRCVLIERNETSIQLPKMERCNARTMEIYRRLGIAEKVRDAGLPRSAPMDVFSHLDGRAPAARLPCPSVDEAKAEIAAHNDGRPLEPYQLISQYTLEPLLRSIVEALPNMTVRFGCELTSFTQDGDSVTAHVRTRNGPDQTIRTAYLVGCDGGSSTVRKQLGIQLQGDGNIRKLRQALFHCPELYERIPMGKGRHYHIAEGPVFRSSFSRTARATGLCMPPRQAMAKWRKFSRSRWGCRRVRNAFRERVDAASALRGALRGGPRFHRRRRAHLVIPTGGLGL